MAFALTACGGSVRVRPVSSWSISSEGAAQAGWFTLTRGAQTVILYCEYDEHSMDEGLRCAAHAVSLSGKADIRLQSEPIPDN
jgi:hypothetical protein